MAHDLLEVGIDGRVGTTPFIGNTTTRDKVLRREFRISEGQYMNMGLFRASVFKVNALGYFKLEEEPLEFDFDDENKLVNVTVKGNEVGRNDLQFGAGYSEFDGFFGINGASIELSTDLELARYRLGSFPEDGELTISYRGRVDFGLSAQKEEYTRGFRETAGIVGDEGVYLAASGFWYPYFGEELIEFELAVEQPADWHVISQGNGTARAGRSSRNTSGATAG